MEWYLDVIKNHYADFDGRARRKEYWMFFLVNIAVVLGLALVAGILGAIWEPLGWLGYLAYIGYVLAVLVPGLALTVRRFHDTGKTGWFALLALVPFVGGFIVLYFMILEGDAGPNAYGPDPKELGVGDLAGTAY